MVSQVYIVYAYSDCYFQRIAESLNMSQKKVRNATEVKKTKFLVHVPFVFEGIYVYLCLLSCICKIQAVSKVFSLDRDAFPSLNGLPGETHHSVSLFFGFS